MAFRANTSQQVSFFDSFSNLTQREQNALNNSWAKLFAEEVFPDIDEERFSVLYSDKASRPNTPVNVIIGALVIKELFDLSDDEIVENLMLDPRYQYALHTTSFNEQPLSDKTLSRFRRRCYDYETTHGVDIFHGVVKGLGEKTARLMGLNGRIRRMDSMMVESNIRRLSRMELLYTCIAGMARYLHKRGHDELLGGLEHYYDPDDYNRVIYHSRERDVLERLAVLLKDADSLLERCGSSYDGATEYQLFVRCLAEQTVVDGTSRRLKTKEDGDMDSSVLQNPSDPDATFRSKAGKNHRGYAANVEETVGPNGSAITEFAYGRNNQSDSQFLKDHLGKMGRQEDRVTLVTDGAYSGDGNRSLAEGKNVRLVSTDMTGRESPDIHADFEFSEDGKRIAKCPAGHTPEKSSFNASSGQCRASFRRECCAECPHKDQCKAEIHKRVSVVLLSRKSSDRAKLRREMKSDEFRNLARIRNGVETIPSTLRSKYHVDKMPVRGLLPTKFFFGCKIAALNFRKLFNYRKNRGHYAKNPVFA